MRVGAQEASVRVCSGGEGNSPGGTCEDKGGEGKGSGGEGEGFLGECEGSQSQPNAQPQPNA
jgi:hypothetical protein